MNEGNTAQKKREGHDGPFPMAEKKGEKLSPPETIDFKTVYNGPDGPKNATYARVSSADDLRKLLPNPLPADVDLSSIDWSNQDAIVVGLGQRPTSGFRVEVTRVYWVNDTLKNPSELTVVDYHESKPSGSATDVLTFPVHIIRLRKLPGGVQYDPV